MNLESSFDTISPCVVGFISKLERTRIGERPIFPTIIGTGFFVDPSGIAVTNRHVVEAFDKIPRHPTTGEFPIAAFVFLQGDAGKSMQFLLLEVKKWFGLQSFGSTGDWYGQTIPDIGFVQLGVREVPFLHLSTHDFYVKVGMTISTVGYPMGTLPLTVMGKLNQMTPFLRQGIVSSVFPFPTAKPHGFTIDVMQQGGSSGSPIFPCGETAVIGLMSSSIIDATPIQTSQGHFLVPQNTNISIAESSHIVQLALEQVRNQFPKQSDDVLTLQTLREQYPQGPTSEGLQWDSLGKGNIFNKKTGGG
jgi:hypothetical protein